MPPSPVVDVHTHVFNHHALAIQGLTKSQLMAHGIKAKRALRIARTFDRLVSRLAKEPEIAGEIGRRALGRAGLDDLSRSIGEIAADRRLMLLDSSGPECLGGGADGAGPEDDWDSLATDMQALLEEVGEEFVEVGPESFVGDDRDALARRTARVIERFLTWLASKMEAGAEVIQFVFALLQTTEKLEERILAAYDGERMDLCVFHMMDMTYAYEVDPLGAPVPAAELPAPPSMPWPDQIREMVDLTWSARGRLAGFVAFDPRRPDALEHVQQAIGAGLVGVKIYPPMGYRPLDARYLDAFVTLYTWCSGQGIPVLAHCSATGFEAWVGHGTYSDPGGEDGQGWDAVLARFPELHLCMGHTGAGHLENFPARGVHQAHDPKVPFPGWYDDMENCSMERCYALKVLALCARYAHAYCDFSYLMHATDKGSLDRRRLVGNLRRALTGPDGEALSRSLMYGSDWHMPEALNEAGDLLRAFREIFARKGLPCSAPGFFGDNAIRFLNLGAAVARLRAHLPAPTPDQAATLAAWSVLDAAAASD
ncbi:MAG: hypothetical protein ABIO70_10545 [Pseudomonadota bacterium]